MNRPASARTVVGTLAGVSIVGAIAGCSARQATSHDASPIPKAVAGKTSSSETYENGTYTAPGTYFSPGGQERISVTLTLASNIVTAVEVSTVQADPTATGFEQMFEGGIAAVVVGKNINDVRVKIVAGSSLTSQGFEQALATIKADAKH